MTTAIVSFVSHISLVLRQQQLSGLFIGYPLSYDNSKCQACSHSNCVVLQQKLSATSRRLKATLHTRDVPSAKKRQHASALSPSRPLRPCLETRTSPARRPRPRPASPVHGLPGYVRGATTTATTRR